jgi:hypothetical protein
LNERKRQQQENDKMKKSLALSKSTAVPNDKDTNNSNILEEEMKIPSIYEADEDVDYEYWSSNQNVHATLSISNSLHNKCMNQLHLPEKYRINILDGGAYTCVLGQGWKVLSVRNNRRANVVGFDHQAAVKRNLPIISAITAVDLPDGISMILILHEAIYNDTANHSLLS